MDYPISVPGVGLVGGKFTDGDPLLSQQASLDPAAWANAVTDELLNVIIAAGLTPNEAQTDQLLQAIQKFAAQDFKNSVRVVVTADIALAGLQTLDGIALAAGDRVLVAGQTVALQNGIYVVAAGAWTRSVDADTSIEVTDGLLVAVEQGTTNADTVWQLVTNSPIVLGTTALTFEKTAGLSGVTAGTYKSLTVDKRGRVTGGTNPTTLAAYGITDGAAVGIQGAFKNLMASAGGLGAALTITADELIVENGANQYQALRNVAVTPSFATAGVNGLDVGAANSQTANTWYYAWVIWNGVTAAGLLSLSASAPTLPAGYTHKALVGPVRTDGTGNKFPLSYNQGNNLWRYKLAAGSNTTGYPLLTSGLQGTAPSTWASVSTANAAPPIASSIHISASATAQNSANTWLAPNSAHVTTLNAANTAPLAFLQPALNAGGAALNGVLPLESATISVIASGGANQSTYCTGFGLNL